MSAMQLTMPNVGEGVTEGTVTRWLKAEGDDVALDEPIVEVETDKAVVEIPSPFAGTLARILVREGDVVPIGTPLAEFADDSTQAPAASASAEVGADGAAASAPATADRGTPDPLAAAATNDRRLPANGAGTGAELARRRRYSPVVLKLSAEHAIDIALVRGTGIEGRVTRQDVLRYIENPAANTVPPADGEGVVGAREAPQPPPISVNGARSAGPATQPPADTTAADDRRDRGATDDRVVPLSATRRTIAARMVESQQTIPVAWMVVEADVTGLVALRERRKEEFERGEGVRLTYMPFFVRAFVAALKEHPQINATYADDGIRVHPRYDIGVAVATDFGLVVPVVRDAGDRSIAGLAKELHRLGEKAAARKLTVEDMRGATLTVDNTGSFGSVISQPIVPAGQVAIVTTEAIRRELRPAGDLFGVRSVMNLCISFDHRAIDGADAGRFMAAVKTALEAIAPTDTL